MTVSQSNDPAVLIEQQFSTLLDAEFRTVEALPEVELAALVSGPQPQIAQQTTLVSAAASAGIALYTEAWLASQPAPSGDEQWQCLQTALYFEARGESLKGQFAVAEVILNRVDSPEFPATVCKVVGQGGKGACQFSYYCDGARDTMFESGAADLAGRIARVMLDGAPRMLTLGATNFHNRGVNPGWSRRFTQTAAIGAHLFYRP